ncbi:MAG TPA: DNA gyrase subunit B [Spirochaetia bacterium]|nr:DNA gyrase subunit B [Spirochaetia bacterium]
MWLGQNSLSDFEQHFFNFDGRSKKYEIEHREIQDIPAKMKCLDEACMNCVDEYRKNLADGKIASKEKMNRISVTLSADRRRITVEDNGRGIPAENAEGVFLHLMYGENFDDQARDEHVAGQNGVGISLVRIVSRYFRVRTSCRQKIFQKLFTVHESFPELLKNLRLNQEQAGEIIKFFDEHGTIEGCSLLAEPQKKKCLDFMKQVQMAAQIKNCSPSARGTLVEFELDEKYFNNLDVRFNPALVEQYLMDIAITNPGLEVNFNFGKQSGKFLFKKGLDEIFSATDLAYYRLSYRDMQSPSKIDLNAYIILDQGKHLTWVNSNFSSLGGSAIEYLENRICDEVRKKPAITALEKKLKTQATRNDVRSCFHMLINLKILNPRFKSQDKSYLINDLNNEIRAAVDEHLPKLLRKTDLIDQIKLQMEKRTHLKALEDAARGVRKASRITIPKLIPPTGSEKEPGRILFIAEGDSAIAGLRPVRNPKLHGLFPLRGKPMNVKGMSLAKAIANEEYKNIIAILGLPLQGKLKNTGDLNYEKVAIITDADFDGYAIRSLMLSFFYEYWPELYDFGFIHICTAPLYEVETSLAGKKEKTFCIDDEEFENLISSLNKKGGTMLHKKRNKGLGETSKEAMNFAVENCIINIRVRQSAGAKNMQQLWFHKDFAEERRRVIAEYSIQFLEE